ncbi:MAG: ATP-binding protein [Alphaproteobacteria bacterium]|nr:ATP-binding protein [Alphaproteobacteria bacterium]
MLGVINDVLDVAKIEAGRLRLNEIVLRPLDLVQKCVRLIEPSARDAGIRMSCRCDLKGSEIRADEVKLQQVLLNLLSNAVKFTPSGGEIRVEADVCMAKGLGIAISDTGIGIPEKDLERIFEPFEQVDSDKNRSFDGTGLGLYIAQALIDMHGGALTLHSAVRQGTTATVRLPSERLLVQAA